MPTATDTAGTLEVNGERRLRWQIHLAAHGGRVCDRQRRGSVHAGDVIAIATPSTAGASETYIDYVEFTDSPFKSVSTLASHRPREYN